MPGAQCQWLKVQGCSAGGIVLGVKGPGVQCLGYSAVVRCWGRSARGAVPGVQCLGYGAGNTVLGAQYWGPSAGGPVPGAQCRGYSVGGPVPGVQG